MSMFTGSFVKASLERAARTFAQVLGALLVAQPLGVLEFDWSSALSVSAMATIVSLLTSIGAAKFTDHNGPSLIDDEVLLAEAAPSRRL